MASVQVLVAFILDIDRDGGIAEHGLGTGGGDLQHLAGLFDRVEDVPEVAVLFGVFDLRVRDRGAAVRAPVDHAVAAIDQAFVVVVDKDLFDSVGAALVHGEALALPVAGDAELPELAGDPAAVLFLPSPCALEEFLTTEVFFGDAFLTHRLDDLRLGGDGGVVGTGQPQRLIALHPAPAGEDVLQGVVQRVTDVQLTRDVGRRHDDAIGLFIRVDRGVEVVVLQPVAIYPFLDLRRVVGLVEFCHNITFLCDNKPSP